ncbi:MAG: hypothetical protein DWI22_13105 [Planctomycetota bacterium]|nr:MAG: hypothetical protein DWI22_13105 [Planctomycetota bacterium]
MRTWLCLWKPPVAKEDETGTVAKCRKHEHSTQKSAWMEQICSPVKKHQLTVQEFSSIETKVGRCHRSAQQNMC